MRSLPTPAVKLVTLLFLLSSTAGALTAQTASSAIEKAFTEDSSAAVISALIQSAASVPAGSDRKQILSVLADYEERLSFLEAAGKHYHEAAFALPSARDDALLLHSARCAMSVGDSETADGLIRAVLLTSFDQDVLNRARLYAAWLQLSSGDSAAALTLLRSYAGNAGFSAYAPALLFTLWWADGDTESAKTLTEKFPGSPEAAILRGEATLSGGPFWYLMDRRSARTLAASVSSGSPVAAPVDAGAAASASAIVVENPADSPVAPSGTPSATDSGSSGAVWQQLGFFRIRSYADELSAKLRTKGFVPVIREETRPSGTVYFAVLVKEDSGGTIGPRLKDAGFESFPLFE